MNLYKDAQPCWWLGICKGKQGDSRPHLPDGYRSKRLRVQSVGEDVEGWGCSYPYWCQVKLNGSDSTP